MNRTAWKALGLSAVVAAVAAVAGGCSSSNDTSTHCVTQTQCGGNPLTLCTDQDHNGVCVGMRYELGSRSFDCNSCADCATAQTEAVLACSGAPVGDAGGGSSSSSSGGHTDGGAGNGTTCSAKASCGSTGLTYQQCTTLGANGVCDSIVYETSDGKKFSCTGCTDCTTAAQELSQYCASGGKPTTTCTPAQSCGSGGLTYQQCTTSTGSTCDSMQYVVSNGTNYACTSCGDCSAAEEELTTFCEEQGTPTTSCSSSTTCGSGGLTYSQCTTYAPSGTCESVSYEVSDGTSYACATCSDCTIAYDDVTSYCGTSTGQTCGSTTCGSAATCCTCSGTPECFTLTSGETCASFGCE